MSMCRACLQTGDRLQTLFVNDYVERFRYCTSLQVHMCDGLPQCLCENCFDTLLKFNHFKQVCIESDAILRNNLGHPAKIEEKVEVVDVKYEVESTVGDFDVNFDDSSLNQDDLDEVDVKIIHPVTQRQLRNRSVTNPIKIENEKPSKRKKRKVLAKIKQDIEEAKPCSKLKNVKQLSCQICNKKFFRDYSLEAHLLEHDGTAKNGIPCRVCNKNFKSIETLSVHMLLHIGEKKHKCNECDKMFLYKTTLKYHIQSSHSDIKQCVCHVCGGEFKNPSSLQIHLMRHTGEKPHECNLCHKRFSQPHDLKRHAIRHGGIKNIQCPKCPKKFYSKQDMSKHFIYHHEKRRYPCGICEKTFKSANFVKIHRRTHTGDRPFECEFCPNKFYSGKDLRNHRMIHTGEKPYKCEYCDHRFIQKCALNQHLKSHKAKGSKRRGPKSESVDNLMIDGNEMKVETNIS